MPKVFTNKFNLILLAIQIAELESKARNNVIFIGEIHYLINKSSLNFQGNRNTDLDKLISRTTTPSSNYRCCTT